MCFFNKTGEIKTAKRDIRSYKRFFSTDLSSPITGYYYELNLKQPEVELKPIESDNGTYYSVEEGYHSFSKRKGESYKLWDYLPVVVRCIIPKGSKYLYNKILGDYVSSNIIIKKIIKK